MSKFWSGVLVLCWSASGLAATALEAPPIEFRSGKYRVALLELFTSEGCSSCPPADRWLSELKDNDRLWLDFVPIAFHVDYWDYIGWQDPYANSGNSNRQRRYALEGGVNVVYTPGFLANGQEWLGWRDGDTVSRDNAVVGDLELRISGDSVAVIFENTRLQDQELAIHVAVLGMGVQSDVLAGENSGRLLKHDFVALSVVTGNLEQSTDGYTALLEIPRVENPDAGIALVAWVSASDSQAPMQAAGGFLPDGWNR